ncbi:MAG: response regulator [Synergistaceae bacterium]|nr:response regulator [Synergistaceae bacterium]
MYKVFFVDDEAAMRAGLRASINWDKSDFVLVGEAPDGEMALSMIAETMPDILITDVRMPFMDGIELSRKVSRSMPWVRIIILSGHDEFEYAKQAISIGVTEYLLKPVTSEILFQALEGAAREIELERERRMAMEALSAEASDARRMRRERELSNLLYGVSQDLPQDFYDREAFAGAHRYQVVLYVINPSSGDDGETIARAASSIFATLSPNENIASFQDGAERVVSIFAGSDDESLEDETYSSASAVKYEAERNFPCSLSIAIGSPVDNPSDLPKSLGNARRVIRHMDSTGRSLILGYRDIEAAEGDRKPDARSSKYSSIIEKSRDYIGEHFQDGSISLNSVAEYVGLSPNHFSAIFSQETGETFIEHLTATRLRNACELLRSTSAKSSEIAYTVGYNDPHYFSYVFKKNMGLSPSEYRRRETG